MRIRLEQTCRSPERKKSSLSESSSEPPPSSSRRSADEPWSSSSSTSSVDAAAAPVAVEFIMTAPRWMEEDSHSLTPSEILNLGVNRRLCLWLSTLIVCAIATCVVFCLLRILAKSPARRPARRPPSVRVPAIHSLTAAQPNSTREACGILTTSQPQQHKPGSVVTNLARQMTCKLSHASCVKPRRETICLQRSFKAVSPTVVHGPIWGEPNIYSVRCALDSFEMS